MNALIPDAAIVHLISPMQSGQAGGRLQEAVDAGALGIAAP
ncbi:MAG: hypothetical protein V2I82_09880 [Halieaceae bacterium]|nr:hypothetical protein [Halieaceae bacterium]